MIEIPFVQNREYKRRDIHTKYGGTWQGGIAPSAKYPYIFIFTGKSGDTHGYYDQWENDNVFSYTGEGQNGDMQFIRGNLRLRDHSKDGKRVFLFSQTRKGFVKFDGELTYMDCGEFPTTDSKGKQRIGIKFFFKRVGAIVSYDLAKIGVAEEPLENYASTVTERSGLVISRVGQGAYRKSIINRWENRCAVTDFSDSRILIASHIHPWKDAKNEERLDVNNGILLSPTYDALFDRHLITFEKNGKIVLSSQMEFEEFKKIGVTGKEIITKLRSDNLTYLVKHQDIFQSQSR